LCLRLLNFGFRASFTLFAVVAINPQCSYQLSAISLQLISASSNSLPFASVQLVLPQPLVITRRAES
jgi:hypothetical protein